MTGTVVRVDQNIDKYNASNLVVTTEKGERNYRVFPGRDSSGKALFAKVNNLTAGKTVDLTLTKNGQYWNLTEVEEIQAGSNGGGGNFNRDDKMRSKEEMRRLGALEVAGRLVGGSLTSKSDLNEAARNTILLSTQFLNYLETGDTSDVVADAFDD